MGTKNITKSSEGFISDAEVDKIIDTPDYRSRLELYLAKDLKNARRTIACMRERFKKDLP